MANAEPGTCCHDEIQCAVCKGIAEGGYDTAENCDDKIAGAGGAWSDAKMVGLASLGQQWQRGGRWHLPVALPLASVNVLRPAGGVRHAGVHPGIGQTVGGSLAARRTGRAAIAQRCNREQIPPGTS